MRKQLHAVLKEARKSLQLCQFCIDDLEVVELLCQAVLRGVTVQLVVDAEQTDRPSCRLQPLRLVEMLDWEVQVRVFRPPSGGFAVMHSKLLLADETVLITGSLNLTHHGMTKNEEHVLVTTSPGAVEPAKKRIGALWDLAVPLDRVSQQERALAAAANNRCKEAT